jgi:DNA-binding transcriptional MocR family regulator
VLEDYAQRARIMGECLQQELGDAIEFTQPGGGLFFWARLTGANGRLQDASELARRAIEQGVAFVPGAPFFATNPDVSTLRLSFATVGGDQIRAGVARLRKSLEMPPR